MRRARAALVVGAVVIGTLVAIGGPAGATSATKYAKTYCTNVQKWRIKLAKDVAAFHTAAATTADSELATAKREMRSFLRAQAKGADKGATALDSAGAAKVKGGDAYNKAVIKSLRAFRDRVGVLADNVSRLSTTNPTAFAKRAASLDLGGFAKALLTYDRSVTKAGKKSPATLKALAKQQACSLL